MDNVLALSIDLTPWAMACPFLGGAEAWVGRSYEIHR
jgi:hypothetical protein